MALAGGVVEAWLNLGLVLADLGDRAGATRAYEQAEPVGDPAGPLTLAFQLRENGDMEAALAAARRAVQAGDPMAAGVVACWLWCSSLDPGLEDALRAGADAFVSARADLGDLLRSAGATPSADRYPSNVSLTNSGTCKGSYSSSSRAWTSSTTTSLPGPTVEFPTTS